MTGREKRGPRALELWAKQLTDGYPNVNVRNMTTSWRNGLAFCALIHRFHPELIDYEKLNPSDIVANCSLAFETAETKLGIPALLDPEDMLNCEVPDRLSILTYVAQFYSAFKNADLKMKTNNYSLPTSRVSEVNTNYSSEVSKTNSPDKIKIKLEMTDEDIIESARINLPRGSIISMSTPVCSICFNPVYLTEKVWFLKKIYHRSCFKCSNCNQILNPNIVDMSQVQAQGGLLFCEEPNCQIEHKRSRNSSVNENSITSSEISHIESNTDTGTIEILDDDESSLNIATNTTTTIGLDDSKKVIISEDEGDDVLLITNNKKIITYQENETDDEPDKIKPLTTGFIQESSENLKDNNIPLNVDRELDNESVSSLDPSRGGSSLGFCKDHDSGNSSLCENPIDVISEKVLVPSSSHENISIENIEENNDKDKELDSSQISNDCSFILNSALDQLDLDDVSSQSTGNYTEESSLNAIGETISVKKEPISPKSVKKITEKGDLSLPKNVQLDDFDENEKISDTSNTIKDGDIVEDPEKLDEEKDIITPKSKKVINFNDLLQPSSAQAPTRPPPPVPKRTKSPQPLPRWKKSSKFSNKNSSSEQEVVSFWKKPNYYPSELNPFESEVNVSFCTDTETDDQQQQQQIRKNSKESNSYNPFEDDEDVHTEKTPSPSPEPKNQIPKNPFEDDEDDEQENNTSIKKPTIKARKSKRAPPPPTIVSPKQQENSQDSAIPITTTTPKSDFLHTSRIIKTPTSSKKKRRAPPPRRKVKELPVNAILIEKTDLEVKEKELERQGIALEAHIRRIQDKDEEESNEQLDEMIIQLWNIVNEKNNILIRQTELEFLRRSHRLEEIQAEVEFQMRVLMQIPEDQRQDDHEHVEQILLEQLLKTVDERNEVVEWLDFRRIQDKEEDLRVSQSLNNFAQRESHSSSPTFTTTDRTRIAIVEPVPETSGKSKKRLGGKKKDKDKDNKMSKEEKKLWKQQQNSLKDKDKQEKDKNKVKTLFGKLGKGTIRGKPPPPPKDEEAGTSASSTINEK